MGVYLGSLSLAPPNRGAGRTKARTERVISNQNAATGQFVKNLSD